MKSLKGGDFKNKKVLVRCDFNVAINNLGEITDDFRISKTLPTIKFLLQNGAAVILMSHLETKNGAATLKPVAAYLEKLLGIPVEFANDCVGAKVEKEISLAKPGQVILLENLRFHKEEKENNAIFAGKIARLGDCYVNEAFSCSHREHASIVGIPASLPSWPGLLFEDEIANLRKIIETPRHPFVVIIGGVKLETKAKLIANIAKTADHVLAGSKIGALILAQKQQLAYGIIAKNQGVDAINLTDSKIHLPIDGILALKDMSEGYSRIAAVGTMRTEEDIYDIGPETAKFFAQIIKDAKTIFFNGPMGLFEENRFSAGTKLIIEAITRAHGAFRVAGGGQTIEAIHKFKAERNFNFLSTGGGATLEFLAGNILPGIAALEENSVSKKGSIALPMPKK